MDAYHALAASYDRLTNDVDYSRIVDFYFQILQSEDFTPRTAVDLACGTGSVALLLAQRGLRVVAVDMSEEMLCEAMLKAMKAIDAGQIREMPQYICQRLEKLNLARGVDFAVCALDSIDYITDPAACAEAMKRIYKVLNPGGCFIFDVNTPEKLRAMDGQVFLDEDDDVYCVWRGSFDAETNICSYGMDLFQRNGNVWKRSFEEHCEYAYTQDQLICYLKDAGFTHIQVYGDGKMEPPKLGEHRIYIKARKGKIK